MATIKDLIKQLSEIENKDQPVIFQYFLAEHFEFSDADESYTATEKQFAQVAEDLDEASLWDDARETINDYLFGLIYRERD